MITSIYISNENIVIASGKETKTGVMVKSYTAIPLTEGVVINGMIINEDNIREKLSKLRKDGIIPKKNIRLVIDRSTALVKFIKIPNLKKDIILEHIKNTFADAAQIRDKLVYDYSIINYNGEKNGSYLILATAIDRQLIEDYIELFKSADIGIKCIDIALNSIIKFQNHCPSYNSKTFIISFVDADNVFSLLFINGKYSFSNRCRLVPDRGTPEYSSELSNFLSTIIQFNKSQKSDHDIEYAIFCGFNENETVICDELTETLGIKVDILRECPALALNSKIESQKSQIINNLFVVTNIIN